MMIKNGRSIFYAVLAAALYAISSPVSKLLLDRVPPTAMAALLYLGAGFGMLIVSGVQNKSRGKKHELKLTKKDLPYTVLMVLLDIAAPVLLMAGLKTTAAANVSLLNNFEIVATSLIALIFFREKITPRLWCAIILITASSILLSYTGGDSLEFSHGSLLVLLACACWGLENNCTRKLSAKDPAQIVVVKGFGSGTGSLIIALAIGEKLPNIKYCAAALLLGFVAYGLSIFFYVLAQRGLGAAKTSAYYAVSPFIGTALSLLIFRELPSKTFIPALIIMVFGTFLASAESKRSIFKQLKIKSNKKFK